MLPRLFFGGSGAVMKKLIVGLIALGILFGAFAIILKIRSHQSEYVYVQCQAFMDRLQVVKISDIPERFGGKFVVKVRVTREGDPNLIVDPPGYLDNLNVPTQVGLGIAENEKDIYRLSGQFPVRSLQIAWAISPQWEPQELRFWIAGDTKSSDCHKMCTDVGFISATLRAAGLGQCVEWILHTPEEGRRCLEDGEVEVMRVTAIAYKDNPGSVAFTTEFKIVLCFPPSEEAKK
jgi:hypothetical protein